MSLEWPANVFVKTDNRFEQKTEMAHFWPGRLVCGHKLWPAIATCCQAPRPLLKSGAKFKWLGRKS